MQWQSSIRIQFNDIFNLAQMPNPTSTNAAATQLRNAAGVPTSGFGANLYGEHICYNQRPDTHFATGNRSGDIHLLERDGSTVVFWTISSMLMAGEPMSVQS